MKVKGIFIILFLAAASVAAYFLLSHAFKSGDISRSFEFYYTVKVDSIPVYAKHITILIPVPQTDPHQVIEGIKFESPYPYTFITDSEYGDKAARFDLGGNPPDSLQIKMTVSANRIRYTALDGSKKGIDVPSPAMRARFLSPDRLIPLGGEILAERDKVIREGMTDLQKAQAIYDYLVATMKYDKSGVGWGRGDALYACDARRGNCTDFHSLFIGMARASGIPARFVMGFPLPDDKEQGEISGYHCWAEFYTDELGWVPVDASEANRHPEKKDFFFGSLDQNRIAFTYGRDIDFGIEGLKEPLNFLIYPVVLVDGNIYNDVETAFEFANRHIERII